MLSSTGRAAVRRIGAGQFRVPSARIGEWRSQVQRVCIALSSYNTTEVHYKTDNWFAHSFQRTYATTTKTTPKAHARKATPAGKPATTRNSTRGSAKKTAAKPKKKKATAKRKPRVKKALTEAQKAKRAKVQAKVELKTLKTTALLSPPKGLPSTAWAVLVSERMKGQSGQDFPGLTKSIADISTRYKNLNPSDREHYNHIANQNRQANEAAYKAWVESHTPDQIRAANAARASLRRKLGKKRTKEYSSIEDSRIPKQPINAVAAFTKERWASGDMKGISIVEANKTLHNEWNTLSASEKKHFEDIATAEKARYAQEYKAVFHRDLPTRQKTAVAA